MRMSTQTRDGYSRFWRGLTFLVRLDMATAIVIATGLYLWMAWH
jgi:hypothetical protein